MNLKLQKYMSTPGIITAAIRKVLPKQGKQKRCSSYTPDSYPSSAENWRVPWKVYETMSFTRWPMYVWYSAQG